jgi:hypothetical protein
VPELADVFRLYGPAYLEKHGATMLPSHRRVLRDIVDCRTPALGGHLFGCSCCGHRVYAYRSCRNRSCPKCHTRDTEKWLEARRKELLPVPYFHVVFTVPHELGPLIRSHQQDLYDLLLTAAPQALVKLAADRRHLGGLVGVMALLHTWSATLDYHPHVHCLVPAGALDKADGSWRPARPNFLVPVRALSKLFKGIFGEMLSQRRPDLVTSPECWRKPWVVYCKPAIQGTQTVLDYLGRYVHRIAITNTRIASIADGRVAFRYKDHRSNSWRTMSLQAEEFIRRFLQHVLPAGLHKIRYVGLWSVPNRLLLRRLQLLLAAPQQSPIPPAIPDSQETPRSNLEGRACPACHRGTLCLLSTLQAQRARPP